MYRICRKTKANDSLLCVNFRIHDLIVHLFSTTLIYKAEWWQQIESGNPGNEVRVVRNLYITASL
jgi:hypothetical protein